MSSIFPPMFGDGSGRPPRPRPHIPKPKKPNIKLGPIGITVLALVAVILVVWASSQVWTEILWYRQMGAVRIILTKWGWQIGLGIVGFALFFGVTTWVFHSTYKHRPHGATNRGESAANLRQYRELVDSLRGLIFWGVPALLALANAGTLYTNWETVLQFLHRSSFGITDPQFGLDNSFFVFSLPFLTMLTGFLQSILIWSLVIAAVINYVYGGLTLFPKPHASKFARRQLGILAALISVFIGVKYWLARYQQLLQAGTDNDGAMYKDINASMPANTILAVISVLIAVLFVVAAYRGTWRLPVIGIVVTLVAAVVIGMVYPALIQQFRVTPNARDLEAPFIQRNIDATLQAYGLDAEHLEYQTYTAKTDAQPGQLREDSESTSQIRVLDPLVISKTVQQLQQSRPYYAFDQDMSVDRYVVNGERRDTVIAMRELNLAGLSQEQQTWVNQHTVYTHGIGVVAAYGNTVTSDGLPAYWEQGVPSTGEMGEYEPRIYFSPSSPDYSIVGAPEGATPQELDYPDDNAPGGQVSTTFTGDGGPSVGNWWNKLLYSVKFGSTDIFFSSQTNSASQILYNRDPLTRVAKVAPFLTLEHKAYPAVVDDDDNPATPKRLVWVVDAYTTSDSYPYAQHQDLTTVTLDSQISQASQFLQAKSVNYMRNSVKAVVDAYDGSVKLYQWDDQDPVLQTWEKVYPGLVHPLSEISGDLMSHLRYPEDLFKVQRNLLTSYHVTDAQKFYTGGDRWRLAQETSTYGSAQQAQNGATPGTQTVAQPPYYLTMQMPQQDSAQFSLTSVFVPGGESKREAMAGFLAVDSETGNQPGKVREDYGKLRLIALPSSTTVPGPGQVQNAYDSNQTIAQQLNLLNQSDSTVIRGNLLTLPVGGGLLYVQPVYVEGKGNASYPVLRSVLTAFGNKVGFASTLQESLDQTFGGDSAAAVTEEKGATAAQSGQSGQQPPEEQTAQQQLATALSEASQAMKDADEAMKAGDWTAYGEAQKALDQALSAALAAQQGAGIAPADTAQSGALPQGGAQSGN